MLTTNFAHSFVGLLAAVVGCQAIEPPDQPSHTAFTNEEPWRFARMNRSANPWHYV